MDGIEWRLICVIVSVTNGNDQKLNWTAWGRDNDEWFCERKKKHSKRRIWCIFNGENVRMYCDLIHSIYLFVNGIPSAYFCHFFMIFFLAEGFC